MNWFKFFRLVGSSKRPLSKTPARPRHQLTLETLEAREVPATPVVQLVTPATGGSLGTSITVKYSIDVTGADQTGNYRLFAADGTPVTIASVTYDDTNLNPLLNFTATILTTDLSVSGGPLTAGAYSLFLRGDQIADQAVPTDTLAAPGQIVIANGGRSNLATVALNGSNLGAVQTLGLPAQGTTNYLPSAAAITDVNNDGLKDLLVTSSGSSSVVIYLGDPLGGFSTLPDLTLDLPTGAAPSAIVVTDLNADGNSKADIAVANTGTDNVSVFLNLNTTAGELNFSAATNFAAGDSPVALASAQLGVGNGVDLVVANSTVAASTGLADFVVKILTGNGDGTFVATPTEAIVGLAGADLTTPTSIAVGDFNGSGGTDDIVVGGATGVSILLNTSTAIAHTFAATFVAGPAITSLATGRVRANGSGRLDVVATTNTGSLVAFLNNGAGVFRPTDVITSGVAAPTGLLLKDLNGTGSSSLELVYVNGAAAGGAVSRAPLQTGLISDANSTATVTTINSTAHGLVNGQRVVISGATYQDATPATVPNPDANGTFYITGVTTNTFQLVGGVTLGLLDGDSNTGTWIALPGIITNVTKAAAAPIVVTAPNHGLRTGQQITIAGVGGAGQANGSFFITRINASSFSLNATEGVTLGTYNANTGTLTLAPYPTGASPVGAALGDFTGEGINDLVVFGGTASATANDNTFSFYTGSGSGSTGDGTFLAPTNLLLSGAKANPREPAVGDLNLDGILDLVAPDLQNSLVNVFLGLNGGGYAAAQTFSPSTGGNSREPVSVTLGDLNGDGKLDIVSASQRDNNVAIFLNTTNAGGALTFAAPTRVTVGRTPTQVKLADINNDSDLDLLVAHNGGGGGSSRGVTVRLGSGNGAFQNAIEYASGTRATGLAVADFNLDGNLDFAVTNDNTPGEVKIRSGDGKGVFTNGGTFTVGNNPIDIVAVDFDNDGYADIATVSRNNTTTDNVSVLLNNLGTGFQTAINTTVTTGVPLQSIAALNVNSDAFIDLVVTSRAYDPPGKGSPPPPPNPLNNTHVLLGTGDGGFATSVDDYSVDIPTTTPAAGSATPVPSFVAVISDPFRLLSTFNVGGTTVSVNLIRNGGFDARSLTNEQGNLDGWTAFKLRDTTRGSAGAWGIHTAGLSPLSGTVVPAPSGKYQAMLDQQNLRPYEGNNNPNAADTYAGSHALYQDFIVPASATSVKLSFSLFMNSATSWTDATTTSALDYRTSDSNQQVRVDIVSTGGNVLNPNGALGVLGVTDFIDGGNVLLNIFQTQSTDAIVRTVTFSGGSAIDLSQFVGQSVRLRIATTNNQGRLTVGLDNVRIQTVFTDTVRPSLQSINLRNPSFLAGPNTLEQSTDPTIVGRIADDGSSNNVKQITFDLANNGFGTPANPSPDDVAITTFDANGFFAFTATTLLPGLQNIPVQVVDQASNALVQTYTFILQGPSLTNWAAAGPGPINVASAGFNYATVSGKITGIAVDPTDPSGNTLYVGSANGGVWKTLDGGSNYLAVTDNVTDLTNQRVNVSVGGLTLGTNSSGTVKAIYAATGVDDTAFTSRTSIGVLRSLDNGTNWQVLGGATTAGVNGATVTSNGIFAGARVSKVVVDPSNPAVVYVAITSWDDPTKTPMILKTTNGTAANPLNVTWTNVLNPQAMFVGNITVGGPGAPLPSVTDLLVDPFNPNRIIIGLGNIGQVAFQTTTGVWLSTNGGGTWELQLGGDAAGPGGPLASNPTTDTRGILPSAGVGRITLAQGTGRVGDERYVYVLIANPPPGLNPSQFDNGTSMGLYKSKDNMLNFTKVSLREPGLLHGRYTENYVDIELVGAEGSTVGAMSVDPSNPNVVYVGGSNRLFSNPSVTPQHALIRVDTGNIRDATVETTPGVFPNDGDDRDKAAAAEFALGLYPVNPVTGIGGQAYRGEGVYWYDIERAQIRQGNLDNTGSQRRLPTAIHRIAFDTQGRLLFGTENGLYRGTALGFQYDFDSSFAGILDGGGGGGGGGGATTFNPAGMTITELNGNLQITDLTSVAIDPTTRTTLYISASGVGTATTTGGPSAWQTSGLTGPTVSTGNLNIPNAFKIVAANLAPDAPLDAVTTLYRAWQFNGSASLVPEVSIDAGQTFSTGASAGISSQDTAAVAPVLAINPVKVAVDGVFYDELLFGTNQVYISRTGGNVFDAIPLSDLTGTERYSALAFSGNSTVYLAGTNEGNVLRTTAVGSFVSITGNLLTLVGGAFAINGITVDPRDTTGNTVFVMLATPFGQISVYRTLNANLASPTWTAVTGTGTTRLPLVTSYKMVIDPRVSAGAPLGRMYLGTDRGMFISGDGGANWLPLGNGLPAAPVVDVQFNAAFEVLAVATQGRGVFTLSTARFGPAITLVAPASPTTDGALNSLDVTFNTPVDPRTFTADSNNAPRTLLTLLALNSTDFATTRVKELVQQYQNRVASQGDINIGLTYFFNTTLTGAGNVVAGEFTINQVFAASSGTMVNDSRLQGELEYTSFLTSSNFYFANLGGNTNATWIEKVWQDLFFRTATGDTIAAGFLTDLNANTRTRLQITQLLTGARAANGTPPGPTSLPNAALVNPLNVRAAEFHTNLVAALYNKLVARNYPVSGASNPEIVNHVATLARGGLLRNVVARIISTTEAYQRLGNDYALPVGVTTKAVALGNLTGLTTGANGAGAPVLDLLVAGSDNKLRVYAGKVGGGFSPDPTLVRLGQAPTRNATLDLPMGADPATIVVADFNNDGKMDIAVANSALTSTTTNTVSVFLNTSAAVGQLGFGTRTDLDGGNNPFGLAVGNVDGIGGLDLVVANRSVNLSNEYTASILLGNGSGGFGALSKVVLGDTVGTVGATELQLPSGLALGDLDGDNRLDLIVSGSNGLVTLINSAATPGTFPTATRVRRTNTPTTSVTVGNLDSDTDLDIVAISDNAAGMALLFRNDGGGAFTPSMVATGANPRQVQLADMTGDGKLDIVVGSGASGGGLAVLNNTTAATVPGPDTLAFAPPFTYPLTGSKPSFLAAGDTNQDGLTDLVVGYESSEFVSSVVGQEQGFLRVATDPNWLDWVFRSLAGRPFGQSELLLFAPILGQSALAFLNGPGGIAAPLSIAPTDTTNMTYRLTFAPRLLDSSYRLFIGPNTVGVVLKDFIDLNGTYANTGNPMNQNQNPFNGEQPVGAFPSNANQGDRFTTFISVNNNDNGRFISAVYEDFQGISPSGRKPDQAGFFPLANSVETVRRASLNRFATTLVNSAEEIDNLVNGTYQRYLRRVPTSGSAAMELETTRTAIQNGTQTIRGLVVQLLASNEYFINVPFGGNNSNATWIISLYRDVLPGVVAPAFPSSLTRTQVTNQLVFSDDALRQTVTEYMRLFLGRNPVRNSFDARIDETTGYPYNALPATNFLTLLRTSGVAGQPTGDQQVIISLVASSEYLRVRGDSNFEWLKSLYTRVLGRATIDTDPVTGVEFTSTLTGLLADYTTTRATVLTTILSNRETRDRFYTDYYTQFLSLPGLARVPTQAELNAQEAFYQSIVPYVSNITTTPPTTATVTMRLEAVVANILRSTEFFLLSGPGSANSGWIAKVYNALLGRMADDAIAVTQLDYLNTQTATTALLSAARFSVALQILNSTEYRQQLITRFYQSYLLRTPTSAELNNFVTLMSGPMGITQQAVLIRLLKHPGYFLLQ